MVKAMIDIKEDANKVLNIIKAKHNLKTKSEAINKLAEEYDKVVLGYQATMIEAEQEEKIEYSH